MSDFLRYYGKLENNSKKKVKKISVKVKVSDVDVKFKITDIMLQEGKHSTGYTINSKEMLTRTQEKVKHYNILIRGQNNGIIVDNIGTATSGLDFSIYSQRGTSGPIKLETLNKTKRIELRETITENDSLNVDSFNFKFKKNNVESRNYKGSFMGIPSIFGSYNVDMNERDIANFVFFVKEIDKKDRY